jgi:hypothetical protein
VIAAGRPLCEYCFAANNVRSVDKLSGRTTDRLGDIRPDTAHTIGGTTAVMNTGRSWSMGDAAATAGAAGRDRQRELRAGWSRVHRRGAAGAAEPSRDYGPAGSSGSLLSGRTTDRLGDIRQDTAHIIRETTAVMNTGRSWSMGDAAATAGAAGPSTGTACRLEQSTPPRSRRRRRTFQGLRAGRKQRKPTPTQPRPHCLARDYGPNGESPTDALRGL